jgi:hypothetical protein
MGDFLATLQDPVMLPSHGAAVRALAVASAAMAEKAGSDPAGSVGLLLAIGRVNGVLAADEHRVRPSSASEADAFLEAAGHAGGALLRGGAGPVRYAKGKPATPATDDNPAAARLQAAMAVLLDAAGGDEAQMAGARRQAAAIMAMTDEEVLALAEANKPDPDFTPARPATRQARQHARRAHAADPLADLFVRLFNAVEAAGDGPPDDDVAEANADLAGSGWQVARRGGRWAAVPEADADGDEPEQFRRVAKGTPGAVERTNRGGKVYYIDAAQAAREAAAGAPGPGAPLKHSRTGRHLEMLARSARAAGDWDGALIFQRQADLEP